MSKYKVCVYAICKNEEKFVDRWMDSMEEADMVVVTDTGSSDNTVEKLRQRGAIVYVEKISPWRFDVARNVSLSHVPDDMDICICTDLDEIFNTGWRDKLEDSWKEGITKGNYLYNWSLKEDGTPGVQFTYFKVHSRNDYEWVYPIHECLRYKGQKPEKKVFVEGMILNHYPDATKSRGSYLELLEMAVEEDPESDRMMHYLGREYMYNSMWDKCIETLKKHLNLKSAWWKEERCASMRWIAKSYFKKGDLKEAYKWYFRAIAECPVMRDAYVEFAVAAYSEKDWITVYYMTTEALKIKNRSSVYVNAGYAWDHSPYDLNSISAYYLGLYEKSYESAKIALELCPNNERLIKNLALAEQKIAKNKIE